MGMCECIYKHGGKVLVKADVKNIIVGEDGNAIGVTCSTDGKTNTIYASEVISTIGVVNTYNLLGDKYHDDRLKRIQEKMDYGVFCCYMFIGLKGNSKENRLDSYNHWIHQDYDY